MYQMKGRVRYSEIDENGLLSINGLVDYFQDCSTFQSEDLGVGVEYLTNRERAWILSSWQIVMERMPALGEHIVVETWPYEFNRILGGRNFRMTDEQGNALAWANSVWVLFDVAAQRPAKVTEDICKAYVLEEKLDMDYSSRKISIPGEAVKPQKEVPFAITRAHLDTNHHVNNGQYIAMAASYLPEGNSIRQMRAEYRMQAHLGDMITPVCYDMGDNTRLISLENESGKSYAVVEFVLQ